MADPTSFYIALDPEERPAPMKLEERLIPDFAWFNKNRGRSRGVNPISGVTTVVIHATAGYATDHALSTWRQRGTAAHWIVPDEDEPQHGQFVWAVLAEALACTHVKRHLSNPDVGPPDINNRSLGIEIVNTQGVKNFTDPFSDWQVAATALIVRYCWAKYPNMRHVISHARIDPADRSDPGKNFPWDKFKALVLSGANDPVPSELETMILPASAFPPVPEGAGGCCP